MTARSVINDSPLRLSPPPQRPAEKIRREAIFSQVLRATVTAETRERAF
jgi:hypothetical protein